MSTQTAQVIMSPEQSHPECLRELSKCQSFSNITLYAAIGLAALTAYLLFFSGDDEKGE